MDVHSPKNGMYRYWSIAILALTVPSVPSAFLTCQDYLWTLRCLVLSLWVITNAGDVFEAAKSTGKSFTKQSSCDFPVSGGPKTMIRRYTGIAYCHCGFCLITAAKSGIPMYSWHFMTVDELNPGPASQIRPWISDDFRSSPGSLGSRCTEESDVLHSRHYPIPLCLVSY